MLQDELLSLLRELIGYDPDTEEFYHVYRDHALPILIPPHIAQLIKERKEEM